MHAGRAAPGAASNAAVSEFRPRHRPGLIVHKEVMVGLTNDNSLRDHKDHDRAEGVFLSSNKSCFSSQFLSEQLIKFLILI